MWKNSNASDTEPAVPTSIPMHVLFLSLRADFGGGPEHLWRLLRNKPSDIRACVACPRDYPYYARYSDCVDSDNMFTLPHRKFNLGRLWQLRRFCRKRGITLLHSHGKGAGLYARLLAVLTGLPCVHTFHGVHMLEYQTKGREMYRLAEKGLALFTRVGIAVSRGEAEQILSEGLMPSAKIHTIENGVAIPNTVVAPEGPPYLVVSISRFDTQKNSEFLVDIFAALRQCNRLDDFTFIIVGEGPGKMAVETLAQEQEVANALKCVGATLEPHAYFKGALAYLSTSRWEGMPLAVLEAMAHGLPTVVTDVVGNRDAVSHGVTGVLYPEGDAVAAATALCQLADDPNLRRTMGDSARIYVQSNHSMEDMVAKTFDVLQEVIRRA